jgi:hypothetical protein
MKKILTIAALILVSASAMATQSAPTPTVTTVLNGTIDVGTYIGAAPGQYQTQTSVGSVSANTTVNPGTSNYGNESRSFGDHQQVVTPVITSSITGVAKSTEHGSGWVLPSFQVGQLTASSIVNVNAHTVITNFPIPVTTIRAGNGGYSNN